jgi:membrane protein implicated in regulation of membrane protease activity
MEIYLFWILIGFGLVIVELLTGTFYLLMLGVAAFGAAAMAWVGLSFPIQALTAVAVASAGCWWVYLYRVKNAHQQMKPVDFAQPVLFESWTNESDRMARVRYRNASWDAMVEAGIEVSPGSTLYITATEGNTLTVVKIRPEWKPK